MEISVARIYRLKGVISMNFTGSTIIRFFLAVRNVRCFHRALWFYLSAIFIFAANNAIVCAKPNCTVEDISEALLAAYSQFDQLRYEYVQERTDLKDNVPVQSITRGTFAQRNPEGWVYRDQQSEVVYPTTGESKSYPGILEAFDGQRTLHLNRNVESDAPKQAKIVVGPEGFIKKPHGMPHNYVWSFGRTPYGEIINKYKDSVKIIEQTSEVNGRKAIKLSGVVFDGRATMTIWVCPELNFLPLRVHFVRHSDNRVTTYYDTSDFIKLPNGLYYPQKLTYLDSDSKPYSTWSMSNISLEPLPVEFFRPPLPLNTHVTDNILKISYNTSDAMDIGLEDVGHVEDGSHTGSEPQQNPNLAQKSLENYADKAKQQRTVDVEDELTGEMDVATKKEPARKIHTLIIIIGLVTLVALGLTAIKLFLVNKRARKAGHK